ncbi:MAG TPA: class I SAM-dependent methyltransferase [Pseudolabrys sp.]|nr:class I SAM-dependent methyltransferase [Pseudolabrys sp.]
MSTDAASEKTTGELFGSLWHRLDDAQYRESVELFTRRFRANGFDLGWFKGKKCLDAGCGSGRYGVAMALHGAAEVIGCDISDNGLATARERAASVPNLSFRKGSVLDLPFADASFDFVCCAGVLHHTPSIARGLDELTRVLRPGGKLFLLLYGAGGLRWKSIAALRPLAGELGLDAVDAGIAAAGLPANNRKHFLDDLFVPIQMLTTWSDLSGWLADRGYADVQRWMKGRFDQEASPQAQIEDMVKLERIFEGVRDAKGAPVKTKTLGAIGAQVASAFVEQARSLAEKERDAAAVEDIVIGEGNHRILATRGR